MKRWILTQLSSNIVFFAWIFSCRQTRKLCFVSPEFLSFLSNLLYLCLPSGQKERGPSSRLSLKSFLEFSCQFRLQVNREKYIYFPWDINCCPTTNMVFLRKKEWLLNLRLISWKENNAIPSSIYWVKWIISLRLFSQSRSLHGLSSSSQHDSCT